MKTLYTSAYLLLICFGLCLVSCGNQPKPGEMSPVAEVKQPPNYGGYATQEEYGEHLVTIAGCNDCHTPKKFGPNGMMPDSSLTLSGHPSDLPVPPVNRKEQESKGIISTNDLTVWTGPWGVSFTANLTPDPTGIGNWDEETFIRAIRLGKFKGIESGRSLLPPMPWQFIRLMTDDELKAIYAYLRTVKPVKNIVPAAIPPALAQK